MNSIPLTWSVAAHSSPDGAADTWAPATVPGAVQLDLAAHLGYAPWWQADNWRDYLWMEDSYFTYRTEFARPHPPEPGARVVFTSRGIDYRFRIALNGRVVHEQEGMFTPVRVDLTEHLADHNELTILIHPAPKSHTTTRDRSQADHSVKPAVSYGWDFHPRLIPLGIWDTTGVVVEPAVALTEVRATYRLSDDLASATGELRASGHRLAGRALRIELTLPDGTTALVRDLRAESDDVVVPFRLDGPALWWPAGEGEQAHYTLTASLPDDTAAPALSRRVGFRRIRLVMNEGAWDEPADFPKTRSVPPIAVEVNGRRVFVRGSNWVAPDVFPGTITRDTYTPLITLAVDAGLNMLRVWGGAIVNKESFHDLCDERGLMVWQEFPLACNAYPDSDEYLAVLEREATAIIDRLAAHPSTAIWCGGNELFNVWSGMTDQSLALRLLGALCYRLDPLTPFIPTSPVMGMAHGHYVFRDDVTGVEVLALMAGARNTAYSEFGISSPADADIIREVVPAADLWPPRPGTAWETHHAFDQWAQDAWLRIPMIEHYFGPQATLDELVSNGQLLQAVGLQFSYEEARRQKPYCSMALNWCLNEPWPTAANNSIVSYPARPKPSYAAVAAACRPALASARVPRFVWTEEDDLTADLFILNDAPAPVPAGTLTASIRSTDPSADETLLLTWHFEQAEPGANVGGPQLRWRLPRLPGDRFKLVLRVQGRPEMESAYPMLYRRKAARETSGTRILNR